MTQQTAKALSKMVDKAFDSAPEKKFELILSYIDLLVRKIEQLETSAQRSLAGIVLALIVFIFIINNYLADVPMTNTKLSNIKVVLPFFPAYVGYLFYAFCTSLANAVNLNTLAQSCYSKLAPTMASTPLDSVFMMRTFIGSENHELASGASKVEEWISDGVMWATILFLSIGYIAIFGYMSYMSFTAGMLPLVYTIALVAVGAVMSLRAYIYFLVHMSI